MVILSVAEPERVIGLDPSEEFVGHAARSIKDERATFRVGSAERLDLPDESVDVAISGLVLNFIERPAAALREQRRVVRPGGTIGGYVWEYPDGLAFVRMFWQVAASMDPAAEGHAAAMRFDIANEEALRAMFESIGLVDVAASSIKAEATFASFEALWGPFLGLDLESDGIWKGPQRDYVRGLDADERDRLREAFRAALPVATDGRVRLEVRASAAYGIRWE